MRTAGILFGLSSALTKPTLDYLHESVGTMLSHWECYALAVAGLLGFVLQQVSLGTGRLAPSVATVSVAASVAEAERQLYLAVVRGDVRARLNGKILGPEWLKQLCRMKISEASSFALPRDIVKRERPRRR